MSTTVELHRKDAELQAVRAELVALRAGVSALAETCAHSSCIHLNDMFGQLVSLLTTDAES